MFVAVAPARPVPSPLVLRRRRVGAMVFVAALVGSVAFAAQEGLADRGGAPASTSAAGPSAVTYTVQPGDTLWAIAERLNPGGDITTYVDALITLNGGSVIQPGQVLRLP